MTLWVRSLLVTGDPAEVERALPGHLDQLRALRGEGRLRAAGALADGDGFVEIFAAADRHQAEATLRASPLVDRGLVSWVLRRWDEIDLEAG